MMTANTRENVSTMCSGVAVLSDASSKCKYKQRNLSADADI